MADICHHLLFLEPKSTRVKRRSASTSRRPDFPAVKSEKQRLPHVGGLTSNEEFSSRTFLALHAHYGLGAHASAGRIDANITSFFW
jgi:hypothetical protein